MDLTCKEKSVLLKAFTDILKEGKGKGPCNINIKYFPDEIHILVQGILSDFEKNIIQIFGQEAIEDLSSFYARLSYNVEECFLKRIYKVNRFNLKFYELESDFLKDHFIYKMKIDRDRFKVRVNSKN